MQSVKSARTGECAPPRAHEYLSQPDLAPRPPAPDRPLLRWRFAAVTPVAFSREAKVRRKAQEGGAIGANHGAGHEGLL